MERNENSDDKVNISQSDHVKKEESEPLEHLIPGYEIFDSYMQDICRALNVGIKISNDLPIGDDFKYHNSFLDFNHSRMKSIEVILNSMQMILNKTIGGNIMIGNIDEKFNLLLETNGYLCDQIGTLIENETGIKQSPPLELVVSEISTTAVNGSWNVKTNETKENARSEKIRLLGGKNVQKPQLMFKDKIDNTSRIWMPRIKDKPNALKPLALYVKETEYGNIFNHPYKFELNKFEVSKCQLKKNIPLKYKSLDDTKLEYIGTSSQLKILLEDLGNYKEIAIDLEHHSYRTFQGITCLMQISTMHKDYLIDTLSLRSELHQLNEIFTKPSILKVFHGADMDILWLQRDLSLYIVNMFDTHQAAVQLNLPYRSLMKLLKKYCDIDINKRFQLADWRIRPLTPEMMKYAREDTHYLLYIKDILTNELIDAANGKTNLLKVVYDRSTDICKRTYVKPVWTEESCMDVYRKEQRNFNNRQMYAFVELHKWRDHVARQEDDSIDYVLPKNMLFNIAEKLPREMQGILACCNLIPPLVRTNLLQIHKIVLKAREEPLVKYIPEQDVHHRLMNHVVSARNSLFSPHDIPEGAEARADLPCLLDNNSLIESSKANKTYRMAKCTVAIFDSPVTSEDEESQDSNDKKIIFKSPYMRYKSVIPMLADQETKELEKKKEEEKRLTEEANEEGISEAEINQSKNKVYEHFKEVSQTISETNLDNQILPKEKNKPTQLILGQMHDRKRKRESNIIKTHEDQEQQDDNNKFSTPTPSLDTRIIHMSKKQKEKVQQAIEERKMQQNLQNLQDSNNAETTKSISKDRKKNGKKTNKELLKQEDILPTEKFDYSSINFSNFQGGSMGQDTNHIQFQQPKQKDKQQHRKKKKQKVI